MAHASPAMERLDELAQRAIAAKARAYCPYSKFRVGAALLTDSGEIFDGCNIENASYPVGVCAERCAMGTAVAKGFTSFRGLVVATDVDASKPASPCGMCRQFIREFCPLTMPVVMLGRQAHEAGEGDAATTGITELEYTVRSLGELLPDSFGPNDLPRHG